MSNPPSTSDRFSLQAFRNRTQALNNKSEKYVQAPRRANKGHVINQLIEHGDDAMSPKATVANKAISSILAIYKHSKAIELYISPGSTWTYDQRFAVLWKAPALLNEQPTKTELMSLLISFYPKQLDLISLGYSAPYQYIPRATEPNKNVYLYFCQFLTKSQFAIFMQYKAKVRVPPQLPNMLQKLKVNLTKKIPSPPAKIIQQVINSSSCHAPAVVKMWEDWASEKKSSVNAMLDFIALAQPHPSNPGFPWVCMTKDDGTSWGSISETNIPLMKAIFDVIGRLVKFMNGQLWKDNKRIIMTKEEAYLRGRRLYDHLYNNAFKSFTLDKILTGGKATAQPVDYLTPHILFTLSAGNVKPVTAEEIGQGKPDRSIFQSPAVIRIMYMFYSQFLNDNWKNPSKISNFGWQNGGTEKLLNILFQQVSEDPSSYQKDDFFQEMDFLPIQEGYSVHEVTAPRCCFWAPDVKAQDNHFHEDYIRITDEVVERDYVSKLPLPYQDLNRVYFGFLSQLEEKPLILTNNSVMFAPKHLNVSGGPRTSQHSNNASNCLKFEALDFKWGLDVKIAHIANGDDTLFMFYNKSNAQFPLGYSGLKDKYRNKENKEFNTTTQINQEVQTRALKFEHGPIKAFSNMIFSKYNIELKAETLKVHPKLSDCEYLSAKIYYIPEETFGVGAFVAARPLEKILYSCLWGQTSPSIGVSPNMIAAMRSLAAYYDSSLVYKDINLTLSKVYDKLIQSEQHKPMPDAKYFESDFFEIPKDAYTTLPDLPVLPEIFSWMTGVEATSVAPTQSTTEGEEFVDYDEEEMQGLSNKSQSLEDEVVYDPLESKNVEEPIVFQPYEEGNDFTEFDSSPQTQLTVTPTIVTVSTTGTTTTSSVIAPVAYTAKVDMAKKFAKIHQNVKGRNEWIRDGDYFHLITADTKKSFSSSETVFINVEDVKIAGLRYRDSGKRTHLGNKKIFVFEVT